ncbi:MAG: RNA pseudouridine synthase [Deltaproteobacteria bacterium]|jgi:23S rRNA-/tRNA-specific pseudouridylate synthase|nr:RNA pseudouridine synthase [Deltaproteobacteria bacterium]
MTTIEKESIQIPVIAVGKGWLAVDKSAGITVHNQPGRDLCALVSRLIQKEPELRRQVNVDPDFGVNPVHRLDKETSGVILLAADPKTFRFFSKQFESRQVKKRYVAVLHGRLENPEGDDSWGTWRWPLAKTAGGRRHPQGSGRRLPCETRFRILDHSARYTMVEMEPLTGRKHQIRRHAKISGHPVVGDARYGSTRSVSYLRRNFDFDRIALHARALTLHLSEGKAPETVETPAIPRSMQALFDDRST